MKKSLILYLFLTTLLSCAQKKELNHTEEIEKFQYELNVHYADKKSSPLKGDDFKNFKELPFFPINESYKIVANFERTPNEPIFEMPTTGPKKPLYTQYGIARFTLNGKELSLRIYQNQKLMLDPEYATHLFIPFNDKTNGETTYDSGRFLDLEIPEGETIVIDFNKAYNPYCAYSDGYSCPIPPKENDLDIEIIAGVKYSQKY